MQTAPTVTANEPKTPKRRSTTKTPKTPKTETATKKKLTLYVSTDGAKRLGVHATMLGMDRSELVESLIRENLKRFVVSDRAKPDDEVLRLDSVADAN
jgi:ribosome-binding protein aMBF1 (putative translation factor)